MRFFQEFYDLTNITLPDNITSIGKRAVQRCSKLTDIVLPNNISSISDWAFSGCIGLTSITIPDSVTSIGSHAFTECYNLKTIYFNGTKDQWKQVKKAGNWKSGTNSVKIICRG